MIHLRSPEYSWLLLTVWRDFPSQISRTFDVVDLISALILFFQFFFCHLFYRCALFFISSLMIASLTCTEISLDFTLVVKNSSRIRTWYQLDTSDLPQSWSTTGMDRTCTAVVSANKGLNTFKHQKKNVFCLKQLFWIPLLPYFCGTSHIKAGSLHLGHILIVFFLFKSTVVGHEDIKPPSLSKYCYPYSYT